MASNQSTAAGRQNLTGVTQTSRAMPRQSSGTRVSCTQKTGAPISRSRTVPPPTPVTSAKKAKVTSVWRLRAATRAPEMAKTAIPNRSSQPSAL